MTYLPNITPEQALAVLLRDARFQEAPVSRHPRPLEAVVGIGKNNHAIVVIQPADLEALSTLVTATDPVSSEAPGGTDKRTVHPGTGEGKVIALERHRPLKKAGGNSKQELVDYATGELEKWAELAQQGKIRAIAVAADLVDDCSSVSYPVGNFEAALIGSVALLQSRLLEQV